MPLHRAPVNPAGADSSARMVRLRRSYAPEFSCYQAAVLHRLIADSDEEHEKISNTVVNAVQEAMIQN
jgi:hypothetical protein